MSSNPRRSASLFDDIYQLQTTVPDIDPEDPEDGFKSGLTEGATEVEVLGSTQLKKQAALVLDDPKYRGKKISRKTLYSDGEEQTSEPSDVEEDVSDEKESSEDDEDDEEEDDEDDEVEDGDETSFADTAADDDIDEGQEGGGKKKDAVVLTPSDANDREKGKVVAHQLGVWDDLIKCRISLQKMIASCNRLPTGDVWRQFASFSTFQKESSDAHGSMRKVLSSLLDLQQQLIDSQPKPGKSKGEGSDEEITSESEVEDEKDDAKIPKVSKDQDAKEDDKDDMDDDDDDHDAGEGGDKEDQQSGEEEMDYDDDDDDEEEESNSDLNKDKTKKKTKRKMSELEMEKVLAKRHKNFRSYRNHTLQKWDEKTRLSLTKIKSKNFAAFDISVLKQIQQVLGNKERLIRRIHQNRSSLRTLGHVEEKEDKMPVEMVVEDDEDEVEVKQRAMRPEIDVNYEMVDDSDFYQMCLRDFIQLKQNEETDPILANKHWLEIQSMRKKHKRKVDTRASKGRKIRYHVKEKLKNFMAPYDKSMWNEDQKDDLFKALFGGRQDSNANNTGNGTKEENDEPPTIDIGL